MSERHLSIAGIDGARADPENIVQAAQHLGEGTPERHLILALALMVEKLAEARRADLDEMMRRLQEGEAGLWGRLNEAGEWMAEMEARVDRLADPGAQAKGVPPLLAETTETKAFAQRVAARFEKRAGKLPAAQADEAHTYRECARILRVEAGL